jgi:acetyl esterase
MFRKFGRAAGWAIVLCTLPLSLSASSAAGDTPDGERQTAIYDRTPAGDLSLDIWGAAGPAGHRAAVVFFHGGGWHNGGPGQFARVCAVLVEYRLVCISPEYSLNSGNAVLDEGAAAVAWVRSHASSLGVNPARIAVGGSSVGGYLAASTALVRSRFKAQSAPNALILLNAILTGYSDGPTIDLLKSMHGALPPTLMLHGSADQTAPFALAQRFAAAAKAGGTPRVQLVVYPGRGHAFWNFRRGANPDFDTATGHIVDFLVGLGWSDCRTAAGHSSESSVSTSFDQVKCISPGVVQKPQ